MADINDPNLKGIHESGLQKNEIADDTGLSIDPNSGLDDWSSWNIFYTWLAVMFIFILAVILAVHGYAVFCFASHSC